MKKWMKVGLKKMKESKSMLYCIGIQNFVWYPKTWHTQQICWHTVVGCVCNLYPGTGICQALKAPPHDQQALRKFMHSKI